MKKFWMVVNVRGGNPPRVMHDSYLSATAEAQRLCEKEGGKFAILETVRWVRAQACVYMFEADDIPPQQTEEVKCQVTTKYY